MKKRSIAILLVSCIALTSCFFNKNSSEQHLEYIPSNTVMLVQYKNTAALNQFFDGYSFKRNDAVSLYKKQQTIKSLLVHYPHIYTLLESAFKLTFSHPKITRGDLIKSWGIAEEGASSLYLYGALPVLCIDITSKEHTEKHIKAIIKKSNWKPQLKSFNQQIVRVWPLTKDKYQTKKAKLLLAMAVHEKQLVMTLIDPRETPATQKQKLGFTKIKDSIANSKVIPAMAKRHGLITEYTGFINVKTLIETAIKPLSTPFGQGIATHLPDYSKRYMLYKNQMPNICKKDLDRIMPTPPRLVFGYKKVDIQNTVATIQTDVIIDTNNSIIHTALTHLNGHIPEHVFSHNNIVSYGDGLNSDGTYQAVKALSLYFSQQTFTCPALIKLQKNLAALSFSPDVLRKLLGFNKYKKGAGASLYNVSFNENNEPSQVSALISNALAAPEKATHFRLVSLDLKIPEIAQPLTRKPQVIDLPSKVKNMTARLQHTNIFAYGYTGDVPQEDINLLNNDVLHKKDIAFMMVDLKKSGDFISRLSLKNVLSKKLFSDQVLFRKEFVSCKKSIQTLDKINNFNDLSGSLSLYIKASSKGLHSRLTQTFSRPQNPYRFEGGEYSAVMMYDNCNQQIYGDMVLEKNGLGEAIFYDKTKQCELVVQEFAWIRNYTNIVFSYTDIKSRKTCDQPFKQSDIMSNQCIVLNEKKTSFDCLYQPESRDYKIVRFKIK